MLCKSMTAYFMGTSRSFSAVKRSECEGDHSSLSSAEAWTSCVVQSLSHTPVIASMGGSSLLLTYGFLLHFLMYVAICRKSGDRDAAKNARRSHICTTPEESWSSPSFKRVQQQHNRIECRIRRGKMSLVISIVGWNARVLCPVITMGSIFLQLRSV